MRLPRESKLLLCLIAAISATVCLVVGIGTGTLFDPSPPRPSPTPRPTASSVNLQPEATTTVPALGASPSPPGAQRSLILIGVNDAQAAAPQLEGVWVVTFRPGINEYYVLSFPPSAEFQLDSLSGTMSMRDIYAEDLRLQIGFTFVRDAVQSRFPALSIEGDAVVDRDDFAGLVTAVGGLDQAGQALAGTELLNSYDQFPVDDNADRMFFQEQVFKLLFGAMAAQDWTPGQVLSYIEQLPQVKDDAARVAALEAFFVGAPNLADSTLIWRNYQPEMEIGATP